MNFRGVYVVRNTRVEGGRVLHTCTSPGEEEGFDFDGVPAIGQAGVVCRPAPPDASGQCEAVVADEGGAPLIVGMRDSRADAVAGKLEEGDYAWVSPQGRCGLWAKASGVLSLRKDGTGGTSDAGLQFEADGSARLFTPFGGLEIGPNGIKAYLPSGEVAELTPGTIQLIADAINLVYGTLGLGPAPAMPLALSTPGPQVTAVAIPVQSIKITPA